MRATHLSLLALLPLTGCWPSVSEDILDSFTRVNDSLEASRARTEQRSATLPAKLPPVPFADLGCPEFQVLSDSMSMTLEKVEQALAPLFSDLSGVPQDDMEAGDRSFMNEHRGEELYTAIAGAYDVASRITPDDSTRTWIIATRNSFFPYSSPEAWRAAGFTNTPRAAAVAMLAKMRLDIEQLCGACDNALLNACLEKN